MPGYCYSSTCQYDLGREPIVIKKERRSVIRDLQTIDENGLALFGEAGIEA